MSDESQKEEIKDEIHHLQDTEQDEFDDDDEDDEFDDDDEDQGEEIDEKSE